MIAWGVLGAGGVARRRTIPAMLKCDGMRVAALMVRDPERAQGIAEEFGVPHACSTIEAVVEDEAVNAVYVATPVYLHGEHVVAAAQHGKHVLCEKPMAGDVGACRRMIAACRANGVRLEICFVLRHWPIYQRVRETVRSGQLGRVVEIRGHVVKWKPRREGEWRTDPKQSGGGCLMDVGSHYLDLFRYLVGEYEAVSYMGGSPVFHGEVEETALVTLRFRDGAYGTLTISLAAPHPGHTIEIYGTQGTLLLGETLTLVTEAGTTQQQAVYPDYYGGLLEHFRRCVEEGTEPICSAEDGLRNIETITAAYTSGETGRTIAL